MSAMNLKVIVAGETRVVKATSYAFPKRSNAPEGFTLRCGDATLPVAMTGGKSYPTYVYVKFGDVGYYLPKNVTPDAGSEVWIVEEAAKPVEVKPAEDKQVEVKPEPVAKKVRGKK